MTKEDFNLIEDINSKAAIIWHNAKYLDDRILCRAYQIKMYALNSFFVEVWINISKGKIEQIKALVKDEDWYGYLSSIDLKRLLQ